MDLVPRDISDQGKSFVEISSQTDKIDKQWQGVERGHAEQARPLGGIHY